MSTTGQSVGGIIGAITGAILGGPTGAIYGAQIGMTIGGLLDPPKGPSQHGPSPDQLRLTTSTYGANIPRVYGTCPVAGNVVWLEGDKYRVKKKKSGGKGGGSVTTYTIFATFAVALCAGPIAGIRRLWIGSNLVYDSAALEISGAIQSGKSRAYWKLYTGIDTQAPDPRYQADKGANAASGWPGLAYIVFYDLPLEKWQNTLAGVQIKAEVVTSASSAVTAGVLATVPGNVASIQHSSMPYVGDPNNGIEVCVRGVGTIASIYVYLIIPNVSARLLRSFPVDNGPSMLTAWPATGVADRAGYAMQPRSGPGGQPFNFYTTDGALYRQVQFPILTLDRFAMRGTVTAVGSVGSNVMYLNVAGGSEYIHSVTLSGNCYGIGVGDDYLFVVHRTGVTNSYTLSRVSIATGTLLGSLDITYAKTQFVMLLDCIVQVESDELQYLIFDNYVGRVESMALTADVFGAEASIGNAGGGGLFARLISEDMLIRGVSNKSTDLGVIRYAVRSTTATLPTLASVVQAECLQSNLLTAGDLDVTGLSADSVRGFRVSDTAPIRASLEPLSMIWPFDVRMHGYKLQCVRRGGASVASVPAADLDARVDGADPGPLLTLPRDMDTQLPQKVVLGFLDVDREYDRGEQESARYNTDARNIAEPEVAVVLNAQEGKRASEVLLYNYWRERGADITFSLPPSYLHLEPADVLTVTAPDGAIHVLRLTNVNTTPAGIQECTARRDQPGGYTSSAVADTGAHTGAGLIVYGPTLDALLDIPALTADGNSPGFYAAACGVMPTWPGALLYASYSDGQDWEDVATWDADSFIGTVATSLGAATCFDRVDAAGTLTVSPYSGTLASVTEAQMLAGANHFAYGTHGRWEILAARTVTLNGDGTYTLQDFLRGRLGTEQYAGTHQAADRLVQLTTAETLFVSRSSAQIGLAALFRPVTVDADFDEVADEAFTYTGVNLKPLSPAYLNGNRHPTTNDWTLTWLRRARINTEWRDYVDVALDEASEAYEVEIWTSGYGSLKRTLTGLTSATATYSSANQVADFGSNQATLYLKIYQLSASVGRGYPLTTSITR